MHFLSGVAGNLDAAAVGLTILILAVFSGVGKIREFVRKNPLYHDIS